MRATACIDNNIDFHGTVMLIFSNQSAVDICPDV
jgi:hypothetical protein